ncbi:alpha/beta fold hydrolase [Scopulibacillus cellulosilyticus]|uniref:Alpha/beta fold hydrolase n=1 Tax=Scopulibacillus cellulosilyticus TaxID=2665665 RepID=A0ABW2PXS3_9BACL
MPMATCHKQIIQYEEKGHGEPVILIHGVGMDHTMWTKQVDALSKYYRVIVYDMLGHGGSDKPPAPYNLSQFVNQLVALMNVLQVESAHIVGFSMGGMVAQAMAIMHPEKVRTLTVMSAVANRSEQQQKSVLSRVTAVKESGASGTVEPAISRWFNKEFIDQNKKTINLIRERLNNNDPSAYLAAYTLFAAADQELWPMLSQISHPTLILTGENDIGSTPEMAKAMHSAIPHSKIVIVPEGKHMLPIEMADIVNDTIHSFISSIRRLAKCQN